MFDKTKVPQASLSWLKCMDCGATQPLYGTTKFRCQCGGLYDVEHDHSFRFGDGQMSLENWRDNFDERSVSHNNINSGVWRFHELIMPSLPVSEIVSLGEGVMSFWRAGSNLRDWIGGDLELYIMPEGMGPTGSFKDFGMTVAISVAKASGIKTVGCASTGDTSAAVAAYAAAAELESVVILPKGLVTDVQLSQPLAHGSKVVMIDGSFDDCMRIVQELSEAGRMFPVNSINPTRIEGHQATVFLAAQFLGWKLPDWFVVPAGNGSNSSSVGKGMRLLEELGLVKRTSRLLAVQAEAANPLARSWSEAQAFGHVDVQDWMEAYRSQSTLGDTSATAMRIGAPVSAKKVMREVAASMGAVLSAKEQDLNEAVMVAGRDGFSVCPQTGAAIAGLRTAVEHGIVKKGKRVVLVSTATGLKFPGVPVKYGSKNIIDLPTKDTEKVARAIGI